MPITAVRSRTLHDALGDEAAADLVDWMQQVDTHRAELRELNELMYARFDSRFNELHLAREAIHATLDSRFNELRMELREDLTGVRLETASVRTELATVESRLLRWSFVFWCGTVAAVAAGVLAQRR